VDTTRIDCSQEVHLLFNPWVSFGSRLSLAQVISELTGIDRGCLIYGFDRNKYSVARLMSWTSDRTTTRSEDMAYSLFRLFDVNMPLLYGKGSKAFVRLQEEILRTSDGQSLLAWEVERRMTGLLPILATSPLYFRESPESRAVSDWHDWQVVVDLGETFYMTNIGLTMTLPSVMTLRSDLSFVVLNYQEILSQHHTDRKFAQRTLIPIQVCGGRIVRVTLPKLIVPVRLRT
jgi:hypothetical protein